jgi:hypothetical protein
MFPATLTEGTIAFRMTKALEKAVGGMGSVRIKGRVQEERT